jgi:hypothetical protein
MPAAFKVIAIAAALMFSGPARAEGVMFDCADLATVISLIADFRDTDASLEKVVKLALERNVDSSLAHRAVIEREIRRLWKEGRPRRDAVRQLYKRCRDVMGDMGRDV